MWWVSYSCEELWNSLGKIPTASRVMSFTTGESIQVCYLESSMYNLSQSIRLHVVTDTFQDYRIINHSDTSWILFSVRRRWMSLKIQFTTPTLADTFLTDIVSNRQRGTIGRTGKSCAGHRSWRVEVFGVHIRSPSFLKPIYIGILYVFLRRFRVVIIIL